MIYLFGGGGDTTQLTISMIVSRYHEQHQNPQVGYTNPVTVVTLSFIQRGQIGREAVVGLGEALATVRGAEQLPLMWHQNRSESRLTTLYSVSSSLWAACVPVAGQGPGRQDPFNRGFWLIGVTNNQRITLMKGQSQTKICALRRKNPLPPRRLLWLCFLTSFRLPSLRHPSFPLFLSSITPVPGKPEGFSTSQ